MTTDEQIEVTRNPEWVTVKEAERILAGYYGKQTVYRWIHQGRLKRRGPFHCAFVRKDELLKVAKLEGIISA